MIRVLRWGLGALFTAVLAVLAGLGLWALLSNRADLQRGNDRDGHARPPGRVVRSPAGDAVLTLDAANQQQIALKVEPLKRWQLPREATGYARVLDPDSLVTALEEIAVAEAESEVARTEYERVKALHESVKGVAQRAVEAAEAEFIGRRSQARARSSRLTNAWGEGLASFLAAERGAVVERLVKRQAALVRVDLPPGELLDKVPARAAIVALAADGARMNTDRVFEAPAVDERIQGQSFMLYFESPSRPLRPGAIHSAYLQLPGDPVEGVLIPRSAVVRLEGMPWVYVQVPPDKFFRREVKLDHLLEEGWFTRTGFTEGDLVVVAGAQALLSDELRYQIQLEDE